MQKYGTAIWLIDQAGNLSDSGQAIAIGLAISSPMTGSLTIGGIVNSSGAPVSWTVNSGTSGYVAAPGAGHSGGGALTYSLSNAGADSGKVVAFYRFAA